MQHKALWISYSSPLIGLHEAWSQNDATVTHGLCRTFTTA